LLLAQTSRPDVWEKSLPILLSGLGLILGAILFGAVIIWWRRRSLADEQPTSTEVWTLDDLRRMRADGSLTEEEYQRLRQVMIAAYKGRDSDSQKTNASPEKWA
jgi:hypothetical protein